jgi:DNA-binding transcriptional regulator YiaG
MSLAVGNQISASAPIVAAIPLECGRVSLKTFAFATVLMAFGSTSVQATSVGSMRMDAGSNTGVSIVAREKDIDLSLTDALDEIKRRSGLTWGQLAKIFNVSRQAVHSWANGGTVRLAHAARISNLLENVRALEGLAVFQVRERLLDQTTNSTVARQEVTGDSPVLASDNAPFENQLKLQTAKTRIKRG